MFIKNLINVLNDTQSINIKHENTSIYNGTALNTPFYLMNEQVISISISSSTLQVGI